jgi:hypothetical protein
MCGIDPRDLSPFQGKPFHWIFPGVETGLNPGSPFGLRAKKPSQTLTSALAREIFALLRVLLLDREQKVEPGDRRDHLGVFDLEEVELSL